MRVLITHKSDFYTQSVVLTRMISEISEVFDRKEPTARQNICWWQIELKISLTHKPQIVQAYYKVIHNLQLTFPSLQSVNITLCM
jgi:hypothetical protein